MAQAGEGDLWAKWRYEKDRAARDQLVARHIGRVRVIAAELYSKRWSNEVGFDDYLQLALLGLLESIERFDPEKGVQFFSYAEKRIRGSILDGLPRLSECHQQWLVHKRMLAKRVKRKGFRSGQDGKEGDWELAEAASFRVTAMLEGSGVCGPDDEGSRIDVPFYEAVHRRQVSELLLVEVTRLEGRERSVVWRHYMQHVPMSEIAASDAVSRGRVSQIHKSALAKLRAMIGDKVK